VLQSPPEIAPSNTWDAARDQGMAFAKDLIDVVK
jgi:hypothetical protein